MKFKKIYDLTNVAGEISEFSQPMTMEGTIYKTIFLLICLLSTAILNWWLFSVNVRLCTLFTLFAIISGTVLGFITIFKASWAPKTAPLYALCQGVVTGGVSAFFEIKFPGITSVTMGFTLATASGMLLAYKLEIIKVTEKLKALIIAATLGVALTYAIILLLKLFGLNVPSIHDSSSLGSIIFSFVVVAIAAFNLLLDFENIENGVDNELPKYMEWYGAFSILVTLIWLYIEILRLMSKLAKKKE